MNAKVIYKSNKKTAVTSWFSTECKIMDAVLFLKFIEYWQCYTNSMTLNQLAVDTLTAAL